MTNLYKRRVGVWYGMVVKTEPRHDKTNQVACPPKDSGQHGHLPSRLKRLAYTLSYPLSAGRIL